MNEHVPCLVSYERRRQGICGEGQNGEGVEEWIVCIQHEGKTRRPDNPGLVKSDPPENFGEIRSWAHGFKRLV